jgi:putative two-component system response regulator
MQMILNGECGAFNPLLLECLVDIQGELQEALRKNRH